MIVMPVTTPKLKIDAVKTLGGEVVLQGESYSGRLLARQDAGSGARPDLRAPLRRPGRDCRPGHDRHGDPAPAPGPDRRGVRGHRRRWADLRRGRVHQGRAARDQGHRRADQRFRRDAPLGEGWQAGAARRGRAVCRRHGRQAGRRGNLPAGATVGGTTTSWSTPTRCVPPSRMCSRTPAASSSRRARWAWLPSSSTSSSTS